MVDPFLASAIPQAPALLRNARQKMQDATIIRSVVINCTAVPTCWRQFSDLDSAWAQVHVNKLRERMPSWALSSRSHPSHAKERAMWAIFPGQIGNANRFPVVQELHAPWPFVSVPMDLWRTILSRCHCTKIMSSGLSPTGKTLCIDLVWVFTSPTSPWIAVGAQHVSCSGKLRTLDMLDKNQCSFKMHQYALALTV